MKSPAWLVVEILFTVIVFLLVALVYVVPFIMSERIALFALAVASTVIVTPAEYELVDVLSVNGMLCPSTYTIIAPLPVISLVILKAEILHDVRLKYG